MENHTTKIPRLRETRYARNPKTCLELKPSRIYVDCQPTQMKRAVSLADITQYKPLTPEQYIVKYKSYPHKFCKKSCIICSMRKPQYRTRGLKFEDSKAEFTSICTQTIPPNPLPERWNAQTQTKTQETVEKNPSQCPTQTELQKIYKNRSISIFSWILWILLPIVILIVSVFIIRQMDALKWVTRKQLRQPNTYLEKLISYFHRDKVLDVETDRSLAHVNIPGIVYSICLGLIITFAINIL